MDALTEERLEVLETVKERLGGAHPVDSDELAACWYLLQHLAFAGYGRHQFSMEPRNREYR